MNEANVTRRTLSVLVENAAGVLSPSLPAVLPEGL